MGMPFFMVDKILGGRGPPKKISIFLYQNLPNNQIFTDLEIVVKCPQAKNSEIYDVLKIA